MKCPKCDYLGFETGDRCKNCGYDFSLLAAPAAPQDEELSLLETPLGTSQDTDFWLNQLDNTLAPGQRHEQTDRVRAEEEFFDISLTPAGVDLTGPDLAGPDLVMPDSASPALAIPELVIPDLEWDEELPVAAEPAMPAVAPSLSPASAPVVEFARTSALPLFTAPGDEDDAPLVRLPAAPRPPLSVRRTPDTPRLRAVPKPLPRRGPDLDAGLVFGGDGRAARDEPAAMATAPAETGSVEAAPRGSETPATSRVWRGGPASNGQPGTAGRRLSAVLIDYAILLTIDLIVIYFTLRMAALDVSGWTRLPPAPLALFFVLIKLAYFWAFTAIGGQTIGKMAARIRVVTLDDRQLDAAHAARRTLLGAGSALTLGLGFLPGLVGDQRALHDRAAGTRVVGLESA